QLDVGAGASERGRERTVVGRRERRRVEHRHSGLRRGHGHRRGLSRLTRMELSYCIVNTNGREHLPACLGAIAATHPEGVTAEIPARDNAPTDGSVELIRDLAAGDERLGDSVRVVALDRRAGKAANDTRLLREAKGRFCLLLNEDSELKPGATAALIDA